MRQWFFLLVFLSSALIAKEEGQEGDDLFPSTPEQVADLTSEQGHLNHKPNPNAKGKGDYYLDANGNPIPKGSGASHLYPPEWVWWN